VLELDGTGPLYHQIYRAFRQNILSRTLLPGEPVPSTRALSDLLKISRNTAVLAYEQLMAEGYLEARLGAAGTIVASVLPPDSRHFISPRSAPLTETLPIRRACGLLLQERESSAPPNK
jgi:DNA-binding transcriptional MocR family regulator